MVEKLKDANTVGLVVGTVGLEGHRDAVSRMRTLCKQAGKKVYVISVGKVSRFSVILFQFYNSGKCTETVEFHLRHRCLRFDLLPIWNSSEYLRFLQARALFIRSGSSIKS